MSPLQGRADLRTYLYSHIDLGRTQTVASESRMRVTMSNWKGRGRDKKAHSGGSGDNA